MKRSLNDWVDVAVMVALLAAGALLLLVAAPILTDVIPRLYR